MDLYLFLAISKPINSFLRQSVFSRREAVMCAHFHAHWARPHMASSPLPLLLLLLLAFLSSSSAVVPIFGFWHVGVVGPYMEVLRDQLSQIKKAVFATNITFIRIMSTD
jgi:hypothetical protein